MKSLIFFTIFSTTYFLLKPCQNKTGLTFVWSAPKIVSFSQLPFLVQLFWFCDCYIVFWNSCRMIKFLLQCLSGRLSYPCTLISFYRPRRIKRHTNSMDHTVNFPTLCLPLYLEQHLDPVIMDFGFLPHHPVATLE